MTIKTVAAVVAAAIITMLPMSAGALDHAPGEVLVRFAPSSGAHEKAAAYSAIGAEKAASFTRSGVTLLRLQGGMAVDEAVRRLMADPSVVYAEPNYIRRASMMPDDTYFDLQWGLHNTGQTLNGFTGADDADMDAPEAWDIASASSGVIVAVIDSGVDISHRDLFMSIWKNPGETDCADGMDNDHNGYADDCRGWDFGDWDNSVADPLGHGTHIAGIIAAAGNNAIGASGVAPGVTVMPLRFLDKNGLGSVADEIGAIEYAADEGAEIINLSFGSPEFSYSERDALAAFIAGGGIVMAAAGNASANADLSPDYPAGYALDGIVSVAASDQNDGLVSFSNYGTKNVDLAAPGRNIYSTIPESAPRWSDSFNDVSVPDWIFSGGWGRVPSTGGYAMADNTSGAYGNNAASSAISPFVSLPLSENECVLRYRATLDTEPLADVLTVEASADGALWSPLEELSGGSANEAAWHVQDISQFIPGGGLHVRFIFTSDAVNTYAGVRVDDVAILCGAPYDYKDGTSMATGFVSGLAALLISNNPAMDALNVKEAILNSAEQKAALSGKTLTGGRVNAEGALRLRLPASPGGLAAAYNPVMLRVDIKWSDNSSDELGFRVERSSAGGGYQSIAEIGPNNNAYADAMVDEGMTYLYRVCAFNADGRSSYAGPVSVTVPASGGGSGGGCFIATASYGSAMADEVRLLRRFRDERLMPTRAGRWLVGLYYRYSPPVADYIQERPYARAMGRAVLSPLVYGIKYPMAAGLAAFAVSGALMAGIRNTTRRKRWDT